MSFEGKISGTLAPQGAKAGSVSGNIGAVVPDIRDESVTTAKLADAAVTIAKLAQDVTALINSKGDASDVAQLQEDVAALQTITEGLGTASTYGVANNLTQAAAGANVLDAYQGKLLGDRMTTAEGDIDTLNDGYTQLNTAVALKAGNGEPLAGYCYMSVRSTLGSTTTVTFANHDHNRYVGLLLIESNSNSGAVYSVGYKAAQSPFTTLMAGSTHTVTIGTNGDLSVSLPSWSKAVLISTQKFD